MLPAEMFLFSVRLQSGISPDTAPAVLGLILIATI
jgi:hypothetical protein